MCYVSEQDEKQVHAKRVISVSVLCVWINVARFKVNGICATILEICQIDDIPPWIFTWSG